MEQITGIVNGSDQQEMTISINELPEKIKKIDVEKKKSIPSSTSVFAKSSVLLPTGVARVKQFDGLKSTPTVSTLGTSSCSATGNPRNKTALAPGHSLMDWIRLGSSGVDLTGVKGVQQVVTLTELAKHNQRNDAWIAIRGVVFNVTRYMDFHPGGVAELMKGVGKDATKMFDDVHAWVNYQSILQKCVVGRLSRGGSSEVTSNLFETNSSSVKFPPPKSALPPEKVQKSSILKIHNDWKQTTNTITFIYKPTREQLSPIFQLIHQNDTEFLIIIHLSNGAIKHEYDMTDKIKWPPVFCKNFDTMEVEFLFTKIERKLWNSYGSRTIGIEMKNYERFYRDWQVISNTSLCENVHILVLKADNYMEIIPVGRHVSIKMTIEGMEVSRSYTPVPPSFLKNNEPPGLIINFLCLIVKRYTDGALSPSITSLQPGKYLKLSNCMGSFVVESFDEYKIIHMLAAGTGLTPMLGIIHRALCRRYITTINLVNFNRKQTDIFYGEQLEKICTDDERFKVHHVLSQAQESWSGKRGIVSVDLLKDFVGASDKQACVFTCGPKGFLTTAKQALEKLGWSSSQIHEFDG